MKIRVAMTNFKNSYKPIFQCGYCDLFGIVQDQPVYYNAGVYGWNCDIYSFPDCYISTGYRNMRGVSIPRDILKKYKDLYKEIPNWTPETNEKRYQLQNDFISELMTWYKSI